MQSLERQPSYKKQKQYPLILKLSLFIIVLLGTAFCFQEFQFANSDHIHSATRYEAKENELDLEELFYLVIRSNGDSWMDFNEIPLPKAFLEKENYYIQFTTLDHKKIASFDFNKKDLYDLVENENDTFTLTSYYDKVSESWNFEKGYNSVFDLPNEFYILVQDFNAETYQMDTYATFRVTAKNSLVEGRSLLVKASLYVSDYPTITFDFSILLEPLLKQCATIHYKFYEMDIESNEQTLLLENVNKIDLSALTDKIWLNDLFSVGKIDLDKNIYVVEIDFLDNFNESLFKTRMVLRP